MSERELEPCPVCGALPIDQVDSGAVRELVRNRYKFSRQVMLDDCASREAAKRIVDWDDAGRLADDEWLVERNETAIIAICRAYLSSRQSILEEAAKVADGYAGQARLAMAGDCMGAAYLRGKEQTADTIAAALRSLTQGEAG